MDTVRNFIESGVISNVIDFRMISITSLEMLSQILIGKRLISSNKLKLGYFLDQPISAN